MKHLASVAAVVGVLILTAPANAQDKSVDNAFFLCKLIDRTDLTSKPCEVSGWGSEVIATIDMNSAEARDLCPKIAGLMKQEGKRFGSGWTLQIKSPYSNGNSIAFCRL